MQGYKMTYRGPGRAPRERVRGSTSGRPFTTTVKAIGCMASGEYYIYMCVYTHAYVCIYIYIHTHMYLSLSIYIYIYVSIYVYIYIYIHEHTIRANDAYASVRLEPS